MSPKNYRNTPRRSRTNSLLLGGFGLFALMSIGIVGTLWIAGVPLNPFALREQIEDPYMVRIPINSRPIPAYSRVDRTHLLNPSGGGLMYQKLPPQAAMGMSIVGVDQNGSHVESRVDSVKNVNDEVVFGIGGGAEVRQAQTFSLGGAIMNINAIIGRVVKADKRAGLGFQESTFFPQGTPEGLAGATPQGMRTITLDASRLTGVHSLNAGDHIDLLASVPSNLSDDGSVNPPSEIEMLAQNAKVLRPVYVRNEVTSSASLMSGKTMQNVPKYEVAIAVAAEDVIPLQNALNHQLPITCVAHSMKPMVESDASLVTDNRDEVRVPVTVRPILAYQVVSRDAFISPATRTLKTETMSRQLAERMGAITSVDAALGAITRQDIPAGRYLRHSDLLQGPPSDKIEVNMNGEVPAKPVIGDSEASLDRFVSRRERLELRPPVHIPPKHRTGSQVADPKHAPQFVAMQQPANQSAAASSATAVGDRPAITRFIPPGRTAFAIPLNRIYGAEHLQIGDAIDLMASYSLERLRDEEETETRPDGTVIVRKSESLTPRTTQRTWEETFGNRAEPWFIASDAIVVAPVGFPPPASALRAIESTGNPADGRGGGIEFSGPPVVIAVESRDLEAVATALATREAVFTVAFHASESGGTSSQEKVIAVAPEPIEALSELSEMSWQGNRRRIATRRVSTSDPRFENALTPPELSRFYGRVLKGEIGRGQFFTAEDFYPDGTGKGLAAALRVGFTLLPIADREIEGVDSFEVGDRVSILLRGVIKSAVTRRIAADAGDAGVAMSVVVAPSVRIARGSIAGQSVLEVRNEDLTRLQAAIARSLTDQDELGDRSHLVAVGVPRETADIHPEVVAEIPSFDPLKDVTTTELIIGGRRTVEVFGGSGL